MKEPHRLVIYARGYRSPDSHRRIYVPIFHQASIARAWLDFFLENEEHRRVGDTIRLESGPTLTSADLDLILKTVPAELSPKDERRILRFKHGTWDEQRTKEAIPEGIPRTSKPEREARPERPPGFVTITELCTASGVLPMHARAALRASGRAKPDYGWAFDPKDVPAIKQICGMK